jgi:hypothetical protein
LQAGPAIPDYVSGIGTRGNGIIRVGEHDGDFSVGQMLNQNCMIVATNESLGIIFVAPLERVFIPSLPQSVMWQTDHSSFVKPDEGPQPPSTWQIELGSLVDVLKTEEGNQVLELFYDKTSGLKRTECPVDSIQRVQGKCSLVAIFLSDNNCLTDHTLFIHSQMIGYGKATASVSKKSRSRIGALTTKLGRFLLVAPMS